MYSTKKKIFHMRPYKHSDLSVLGSTRYFYPFKMVIDTSLFVA